MSGSIIASKASEINESAPSAQRHFVSNSGCRDLISGKPYLWWGFFSYNVLTGDFFKGRLKLFQSATPYQLSQISTQQI